MTTENAELAKLELWSVTRSECCGCTVCRLASTRSQVVFGEGDIKSPLAIVGEGPGEQEDLTGRPFVGRAGALLDEVLRENRILRKHVYITNVLKCRACEASGMRKQNRPPAPDEVASCRRWLAAELEIVRPMVILCLGGPAASWIIQPEFRITRDRGRFFSTEWGRSAIAAFHPAYVLRQSGAAFQQTRALLVQDIGAARQKILQLRREQTTPAPDSTPTVEAAPGSLF